MSRCVIFVAAAATAVLISASAPPARASPDVELVGTFVFSCSGCPQEPSGASLFSVAASGRGFRRLAPDAPELAPYYPAWDPRGRTIAFSNALSEIWTISADGAHRRQLTAPTAGREDSDPTWSPNARVIFFSRNGSVYKIGLDRSKAQRIVPSIRGGGASSLDMSPDGRRLVFDQNGSRLWMVGANGRGLKRVGPPRVTARSPRWSPDGKWIAFIALRPVRPAVMLMRADGSNARIVLSRDDIDFNTNLAWSPDGRRIAFIRERLLDDENFEGREIVTIRRDGSDQRAVVIPELPSDVYAEIYGIDWSRRR